MSRKSKTRESEKTSAIRRAPERSARAAHELAPQAQPAHAFTQALSAQPQSLAPTDILALQQSVGNRATQQIIGAMLGQAGGSTPVQAKLTLGAAGDQYEQEADRVAAEVTRAPDRAQQPAVQRATDEEELQMKSPISHVASGGQAAVAPGLESAIGHERGGGQALPGGLRARMERAFGADFSDVHVHTDAQADGLNRSLEARAFTAGQDLFFRHGEYNPDSSRGQELIAHELTHVMQQSGERGASDKAQTVASSPVLQRKNLVQAGAKGLTDDKTLLALIGDGRQANTYSKSAPESANKAEALNKAGEVNAKLGSEIASNAVTARISHKDGSVRWTSGSEKDNFNKKNINALDPFFYRVHAPFKEGDKKESLELVFQHALNFTGYVVWIKDSSNKATTNWVSMYEKYSNKPLKGTDKFSNVHDISDNAKLIDLTSGGEEKHLDAYTKIAGEGARWQCVRKHAANLQNDSYFFTRAPSDATKVWAITFQTLWGAWASDFNKAYNIPDSAVVKAIMTLETKCDKGSVNKPLSDMRESVDYDLDSGQSYVKPKDAEVTPVSNQSAATSAVQNK